MSTVTVSTKGRIVLPAALRRRLGMGAGTRLEVIEEADGLRLRVVYAIERTELTSLGDLAGLVTAPSCGVPRRLADFDPAAMTRRRLR
jgi:AbrB family looped-hinge helix DNA binding protein